MVRLLLPALVMLAGCPSSVLRDYEDARARALADPPAVPADWTPDAVLHLSGAVVDELVGVALADQSALTTEKEFKALAGVTAKVTPQLEVKRLDLGPSKRCKECLTIDAELVGRVGWKALGASGNVPTTVSAVFDVEFSGTEQRKGMFVLTATPRKLTSLELDLGSAAALVRPILEGQFRTWLEGEIFSRSRPISVAKFGSESLPLRALRVQPRDQGLTVSLLTRAADPGRVVVGAPRVRSDWQLQVAEASLASLARRASFAEGPVAHDVVVEVQDIQLGEGQFGLGMRLWRPVGRGWWRDYRVAGDLSVGAKGVQLTPSSVEEVGQSDGAFFADPLASLGEGFIVRGIEQALQTTLPAGFTESGGSLETSVTVRSASGRRGIVTLEGELEVQRPGPSGAGPRPKTRRMPRRAR